MPAPGVFENSDIAFRRSLKGHRSTGCIGALAHRLPPRIVRHQAGDLGADGRRVAERNENAASVREQFARMPIRRGDDRFPQSKTIGQCARRHLRLVEIGRDVDVAHRNEAEQRCAIDELIEKHDMLFDAESTHPRDKALAIGLALIPDKVGMGRAKNDIDGVGAAFQD